MERLHGVKENDRISFLIPGKRHSIEALVALAQALAQSPFDEITSDLEFAFVDTNRGLKVSFTTCPSAFESALEILEQQVNKNLGCTITVH